MSLSDVLSNLGSANLADGMEADRLGKIASDVKKRFDQDWESMSDWCEALEESRKLLKPEFKSKSTPWEGASNYKSSILSKASIRFGDKASVEIMTGDLVKSDIIGVDKDNSKAEKSKRVREAMNYDINYQQKDWRRNQKRLFYILPNDGTVFKKTQFDPLLGRNVSDLIQYPNFAVNIATTTTEDMRSFTHILEFDKNDVFERQSSGLWLDVDLYPEGAGGDEGSNEKNEADHASDNDDRFLEQHCFADLDDDGYEEPYIVTIHERSCKVVRIVPRYDLSGVMVQYKQRVMSLIKAQAQKIKEEVETGEITLEDLQIPEVAQSLSSDMRGMSLVRINPSNSLTKYGFIPSPDGTFLDYGYAHLLGAITQGVNATTNMLLDAGKLRNVGGGLMAKGLRKKMGPVRMKIGEWVSTELPVNDLKGGLLPNPNPEPSSALQVLNQDIKAEADNLMVTVDMGGQIQANTAPTTALAIVQENMISTTALIGRLIDSMGDEFQIMYKLNGRFFDPELYKAITDDPNASVEMDFSQDDLDIVPTANPMMSSQLQKITLAEAQLARINELVAAGGSPIKVVKDYYQAIGTDDLDALFPDKNSMSAEEQQMIRSMTQQQELANQLQQAQVQAQQLQISLLEREQDRLDKDLMREFADTISQIAKRQAETVKTLEEAETESLENSITSYTASMEAISQQVELISNQMSEQFNARNSKAPSGEAIQTSDPRVISALAQ